MKIIHCADIHLDSPFAHAEQSVAGMRRHALRSAFSSLMLYAKTNATQLVLISGDLFDGDCVTKDTALMLVREMSSLPNCKFVIAPGNHDPYNEKSPYQLISFPSNVYIFKSREISFFEFPELSCRVYGYAFTSDTYSERPLADFVLPEDGFGGVNLLCAHCDLGVENSYYAPISKSELQSSGFDYCALGHIHKASEELLRAGNTVYAYSGCLEGRSFDETGCKGAVVGEISKGNIDVKKVRFCSKHYEKISVDVTGARSISDCEKALTEACAEFDADTILRITLTGVTAPEFVCREQAVSQMITHLTATEIKDETLPLLDMKSLKTQNTLSGEFYRKLESMLMSDNQEQRKKAAGALKYGLCALSGIDIT